MERSIAEAIVEAGQDLGFDLQLMEDYSGRGMYGSTTAAISAPDVGMVIAAAFNAGAEMEYDAGAPDDLGRIRLDSLGLGVVVY